VSDSKLETADRLYRNLWGLSYLGHIPLFPALWGSLAGVPIYFLLLWLGWKTYLGVYLFVFLIGLLAVSKALASDKADDPRIVIDKLAGYLTAMFLAPSSLILEYCFLWALFFFLLFYSVKRVLIKNKDKIGRRAIFVMLDDVACGLLACLSMWMLAAARFFLQSGIQFIPAVFLR
jgi:phosphatidylglycerophosphatase A